MWRRKACIDNSGNCKNLSTTPETVCVQGSTTQASDWSVLHAKEKAQATQNRSLQYISGVHDIGVLTPNDPIKHNHQENPSREMSHQVEVQHMQKGTIFHYTNHLIARNGYSTCGYQKPHDPQPTHACWSYSFNYSPECLYKNGHPTW